jgi:hypothetical protein
MEQGLEESQQALGGRIPLGARLSLVFLNAIVIILVPPTALAALVCLVALVKVAAIGPAPGAVPAAIVTSLFMLAGFCGLLGILLGACWLALIVRAPHGDPARARWPDHPGRVVARPLLVVGQAYSILAIAAWITILIAAGGAASSWPWLCFWVPFGIGCRLLSRRIDRDAGAH